MATSPLGEFIIEEYKFEQPVLGGAWSIRRFRRKLRRFGRPSRFGLTDPHFSKFGSYRVRRNTQPQSSLLSVLIDEDDISGFLHGFRHGAQSPKPTFV